MPSPPRPPRTRPTGTATSPTRSNAAIAHRSPPASSCSSTITRSARRSTRSSPRRSPRGETNPYDSHPTLADRLRAVGAEPTGEVSPPAPPDSAAALLRDLDRLEHELLAATFGRDAVSGLGSIAWEEAGRLYADEGDALATQHGPAFVRLAVADVAGAAQPDDEQLAELRSTLGVGPEVAVDELSGFWRFALGRLLLAALRRDGWEIVSIPGQPVSCRRGEDLIEPYGEVERARQDPLAAAEWAQRMERLGVAGLALVAPAGVAVG